MDAARRAAAQAVMRLHRGGWANLTAKTVLSAPSLTPRDRAFAAAVFYGTAERLVTLDALLRPLSNRPLEKLDGEVRAILETALYQMRYMRVPPSAAVDEAVKLTRGLGKSSAAGFVNAVLRKAGKAELPDTFASELERVQVTWSVSEAVARAVMKALPNEYDEFLAASYAKEELCLRVNTLKTSPSQLGEALEGRGAELRPGFLPGALYARLPGGVAGEPLFAAGMYHVQGEASQLACACLEVKPGQQVLDCCAAPGGKTATLAQQMGGEYPEGGFVAGELRENRVPLITETLDRLGIKGVRVVQQDATVYNEGLTGRDCILCDVPCSGLGVLGKKPDLRYNDGAGFAALPALQLKVLRTASRYLNKGGRLVYSTCTIRPEENAGVVRAFLAENAEFAAMPPPMVPKGALVEEQMMTILPNRTGLDGFFVATLERL